MTFWFGLFLLQACFTHSTCDTCAAKIQEHVGEVLRIVGGISLFFSFTEVRHNFQIIYKVVYKTCFFSEIQLDNRAAQNIVLTVSAVFPLTILTSQKLARLKIYIYYVVFCELFWVFPKFLISEVPGTDFSECFWKIAELVWFKNEWTNIVQINAINPRGAELCLLKQP